MTARHALFLVGRDGMHPGAAGGDLQAWQWANHLVSNGWRVTLIGQSADGLPDTAAAGGVAVLRLGTGARLAWRAFRYYRRYRADIDLVYEDPIGAGRVPYLSPLYARVPVIAVWHQVSADLLRSMHHGAKARVLPAIEKAVARLYRRALFWAPSAERADEIAAELRIDRDRIHVVAPTLATGLEIAEAPEPHDEQTIVCVGVLRTYKHFEHVIEALHLARHRVPDARLVIAGRVGSRDYLDSLHALVERRRLGARVRFEHDLADDARQALMRRATVLVLPSLLEGFGIVSIEANAEGTPVIASSGVPIAAVEHGTNGLRFEFGDVPALADRLTEVLTDSALRDRLGEA